MASKTMVETPTSVGKYHRIDNRSSFILEYIMRRTYGSYTILSKTDYEQIAKGIRISTRKVRQRIATMEKYRFLRIDKTIRPHKIFIIQKGKAIASIDHGSKAMGKSPVLSNQGSIKPDLIRPHEVWVNLWIREPFTMSSNMNRKEWDKRRDQIIRLKYKDTMKVMELENNNTIYEFVHDDIYVRSTPSKLILRILTDKSAKLFSVPEMATMHIFGIIEEIAPKIENVFKVKVEWDNKIMAEISKESYALVMNEFARQILESKDEIKRKTGRIIDVNVYDDDGNVIYTPDRSLGVHTPEMDSEGRGSEEYARKLQDLCSDVGTGKFSAEKTTKNLQDASEIVMKLAEEQSAYREDLGDYGKKIAAHGSSIKTLGEKTGEFTDVVTSFKEDIKDMVGELKDAVMGLSTPKRKSAGQQLKDLGERFPDV